MLEAGEYKENEESAVDKKPFLKRNEGLKKRFNIDPASLRLHNLPKYKFATSHKSRIHSSQPHKTQFRNSDEETQPPMECSDSKTKPNTSSLEEISWAKVLDPLNLKPIKLSRVNDSTLLSDPDETDNLSIFELLERESNNDCGRITDSFVRKWIETKTATIELDDIGKSLSLARAKQLKKIDIDSVESSFSEISSYERTVHFSDEVCVKEVFNNDFLENASEAQTTSTPSNQKKCDSTINSNKSYNGYTIDTKEQQEGSDFLMDKLKELEEQIDVFKRTNKELMKEKQDYDIERANFELEKTQFYADLMDEQNRLKTLSKENLKKINESKKIKKTQENDIQKQIDLNSNLQKVCIFLMIKIDKRSTAAKSAG